MYNISVPIMNKDAGKQGREKLLEGIKRLGAQRVFCAQGTGCCRSPLKEEELAALRENCAFFHKEGLEVGAWLWAFQLNDSEGFTHMRAPDGRESQTLICPLDEDYIKLQGSFLAECAKTGVDLIMFDDDYRFGFQDMGIGCVCDRHLALIEKELGEKVSLPLLKEKLLSGSGGKYRRAFLKANGLSLEYFARRMREYVDTAAPDVRLGFCSCITSWDIDGTTPDRLSRIMAGKTKPFYRLIGAPYWAALRCWNNRLQDVIDFERFECSQNFDKDIEIFSEGDVYPRPRYRVPAAYLEGLDTALRAAGGTHGMLKYALDYTMAAGIEDGYIKAAERNKPLYEKIAALFDKKECTGVRVYIKPDKYADTPIPERIAGTEKIQDISFPRPAKAFNANGIPLVFEGRGVTGAAFGEDVNAVPEEALQKGLIIDAAAAGILQKKGIDTGIESFGEEVTSSKEIFRVPDTCVSLDGDTRVRRLTLKSGILPESEFVTQDGNIPASFFFENKNGQKFLVFAFDAYFTNDSVFRQYPRAQQLINAVPRLSGEKLPAVLCGSPDAYVLTKTDGERCAVGVWNFSVDTIYDPVIDLDGDHELISAVNCTAKTENGKLFLSDLIPFAFAGAELRKKIKEA